MKHFSKWSSIVLTAGIILAACGNPARPADESSFKLIILKQDWNELNMGYDGEQSQALLKSADITDPLFIIDTGGIEEYDWNFQTITLTGRSTSQLLKALAGMQGVGADEIASLQDLKDNSEWGNPIENALYIHPFVVQANNRFKYGGIFLNAPSQMAIDFPVIRIKVSDGKVTLALLPTHIPFVMIDPIGGSVKVREPVVATEATQAALQTAGIIKE